jgi:hypothetical protein
MKYGRRMFLVLMLILTLALPASAAQRVDKIPTLKPFTAARFELAFTLNGELFIAGKGQMENANRLYMTLKTIIPGLPADTAEIVFYDGTLYMRENDDPQWYIEETGLPMDPPQTGGDINTGGLPVTWIQTMTIAGVQVDQYQVWVAGESPRDYGKIDYWLGKTNPYLYQQQISVITEDEDIGEFAIADVVRLYDMDAAGISVGRPANAKPRDNAGFSTLRLPRGMRGRGFMATMKASFIRDAAVARFGN